VLDLRNNSLRQLRQSALAATPALQEVYLSGKWILYSLFREADGHTAAQDIFSHYGK
jgi:hypothetical protein